MEPIFLQNNKLQLHSQFQLKRQLKRNFHLLNQLPLNLPNRHRQQHQIQMPSRRKLLKHRIQLSPQQMKEFLLVNLHRLLSNNKHQLHKEMLQLDRRLHHIFHRPSQLLDKAHLILQKMQQCMLELIRQFRLV